jgi:hypothetical protein
VSTKLTIDKAGQLARIREQLVAKIDDAWAKFRTSIEQVQRRHYNILGDLFLQLRKTFKADTEFGQYCKKHWPNIHPRSRSEYMAYCKRVGRLVGTAVPTRKLPPLRKTTYPNYVEPGLAGVRSYKRIVDDEMRDGIKEAAARFEIPRTQREQENELVTELATKIINAGFRVLSVKMHPDKDGGSNEAQRRLNAAKKLLEKALKREALWN